MALEFLDPNSDIAGDKTYTDIDDAVRDPTDAETGGDGNNIFLSGKADNMTTYDFGCESAVNTGTATKIVLKIFHSIVGTFSKEVNIRINSTWQTGQSPGGTGVAAWNNITWNGSWDMATEIKNMGLRLDVIADMGGGDDWQIHAAYLEVTYTAGAGSPAGPSNPMRIMLGTRR